MLPIFLLPKLKKMVTEILRFQIIFFFFGGYDALYFTDMILEPIDKFNATHFTDGR